MWYCLWIFGASLACGFAILHAILFEFREDQDIKID